MQRVNVLVKGNLRQYLNHMCLGLRQTLARQNGKDQDVYIHTEAYQEGEHSIKFCMQLLPFLFGAIPRG